MLLVASINQVTRSADG